MKTKELLKEGEGIDKMRFSVDVFFDTKVTGKMDPHRIEAEITNMLEDIFASDDGAELGNDMGVDDIRVRREG